MELVYLLIEELIEKDSTSYFVDVFSTQQAAETRLIKYVAEAKDDGSNVIEGSTAYAHLYHPLDKSNSYYIIESKAVYDV